MTVDECHERLLAIRRKQGTRYPLIRVEYAGTTYGGRLARSDSDPENRRTRSSPYGVLVLESLGLMRSPETILQIANIRPQGIDSLDDGR